MSENRKRNWVFGRSRKGAWIEIKRICGWLLTKIVAPVRERGLKLEILNESSDLEEGRSREGAWIEICQCSCSA